MRNCFYALVFIFGIIQSSVVIADSAVLEKVDSLRHNFPAEARTLLSTINPAELSASDANTYEYLDIYLSTFTSTFEMLLSQYEELLPKVQSETLRFKIYAGMMISHQATNNWPEGLALAEKIIDQFERSNNKPELAPYLFQVAGFYSSVDEYELALDYLDLIIDYSETERYLCSVIVQRLDTLIQLEAFDQISRAQYESAISLCGQRNSPLYVSLATISFADYLQNIGAPIDALDKLATVESYINDSPFVVGQLYYLLVLGRVYEALNNDELLDQVTEKIIGFEAWKQYAIAYENATLWRSQLAAKRGDYQLAYDAFLRYEELRQEQLDIALLKQKAVQQSRFDSIEKQARIELLDKENQLLKTEAELSAEQIENSVLAFVLLSGVFTGLMIWSYRSRRLRKRFERLANTDGLTQIANRTAFVEQATLLLEKGQRRYVPAVLILFDLDKFKHINDSYGHQTGDWALQSTVQAIQAVLDEEVLFARMGGEEFGVLEIGLTQDEGSRLAEKMRATLESINTLESGHSFHITASFGVTDSTLAGYKLDTLIASADLALYQAKKRGRNQVFQYNKGVLN